LLALKAPRAPKGDAASEKRKEINVPKYVIERDIPGVGNLSAEQLQAISQKSCDILRELGPQIQWLHSYVTGDKIYCIFVSPVASPGCIKMGTFLMT
jgi:hypothetical protein